MTASKTKPDQPDSGLPVRPMAANDELLGNAVDPPVTAVGDPAPTAEAIERHQDMVYALCLTHTRCREDADDVFQEVFLTFHRKQPHFRDGEHRKAWLITTTLMIARRVATSSWRTRVVPLHPEAPQLSAAVEPRFETTRQDDLFTAVRDLPETYRSVIHLFYIEDLPVARIANLLGVAPSAVKMRLSRARAMLRSAMTKEENHD